MKLDRLMLGGAAALLVSLAVAAQDKSQQSQSAPPSSGQSASPSASQSDSASGGASAARGSVPVRQNQTRKQLFDQLDSNRNESVSRSEAQASEPLMIIFVEMDTNSDGELSAAEFDRVPLVSPDGTPAR